MKSAANQRRNRWETQFDLVAPLYPVLERWIFGRRLDGARMAFYDAVLQSDRILLVGEGNGRFLRSLLARKIGGCGTVVEKSRAMLRLAVMKKFRGELAEARSDAKWRNPRPSLTTWPV